MSDPLRVKLFPQAVQQSPGYGAKLALRHCSGWTHPFMLLCIKSMPYSPAHVSTEGQVLAHHAYSCVAMSHWFKKYLFIYSHIYMWVCVCLFILFRCWKTSSSEAPGQIHVGFAAIPSISQEISFWVSLGRAVLWIASWKAYMESPMQSPQTTVSSSHDDDDDDDDGSHSLVWIDLPSCLVLPSVAPRREEQHVCGEWKRVVYVKHWSACSMSWEKASPRYMEEICFGRLASSLNCYLV